jgi:predicted ATP-grasp superfamily ATP-dependent carboligase
MSSNGECGAVVVGGYITGLSTVRALAGLGIPIAVILTDSGDIAHYSRWVSEYHKLFQFSIRPESLLELLEQQSRRWDGWVVLPSGDEAVTVLSRYHEHLERRYRIFTPPWEVTRNLLCKDLVYKAADELGLDIPYIYGDATPETILHADIKFPVVVKPIESRLFVLRFGMKLFVAWNRTELLHYVQELQAVGLRAQIQDLIPGPDNLFYNYTVYVDRTGEPVAELSVRKLRKSPPFFGVVRVAETAKADELKEPTLELIRRIGWRGMASAEYKLDPRDGRYRLMEINCRPFLLQGLAWRAGVNYPLLAWREAAFGERVSASSNGWNGVWIHFLDDIYYGTFFRRIERLSLRQYLAPYRRPKTFAVWSAADPKPFIMHCYKALEKAAAAAVNPDVRAVLRTRVQDIPIEPYRQV